MKKLFYLVALFGLFSLTFSCDKEDPNPEYPFTIQVKTFEDSVRVSNILVVVTAPVRNSIVYFEGYTNPQGQVNFNYDKDAIFLVRATRGEPNDPTYIGCAEVRLEANKRVTKTVYLQRVDPEIPGC